jgi:hypothetical protein
MNAIVMHTHLHRLFGGRVAPVFLEGRHRTGYTDRFAPRRERFGHVAIGHHQRIGTAGRDGFEA